jgi:hypothetical protein
MLSLMMPLEDIRQHITVHGIEIVLELLSNQNWGVHASATQCFSKLLEYSIYSISTILSGISSHFPDDIRRWMSTTRLEHLLVPRLNRHDQMASALVTISMFSKYGIVQSFFSTTFSSMHFQMTFGKLS